MQRGQKRDGPSASTGLGIPRISAALLALCVHPDDRPYALADLEEEFEQRVGRSGVRSARRWYREQVIRSLLPAARGRILRRGFAGRRRAPIGEGTMGRMIRNFTGDLRLAFRSLRKSPGVLVITVVSLGFGIGAVTAVFGIVNSLVFRGTAGISDPETLVAIYTAKDDGEPHGASSYPDYLDIVSEISAIDEAAAVSMRTVSTGEGDNLRPLLAEEVTGNFFDVMGIQPVIGRGFDVSETVVSGPERLILISHHLWLGDFAGDPSVLGATLRINENLHTIIGVVPDGVVSRVVPLQPDIWLPLASLGGEAAERGERLHRRDERRFMVLARLAAGASQDLAASQLTGLATRLYGEYTGPWSDDRDQARTFSVLDEGDSRLNPGARGILAGVALFIGGAAGLILLIACANVTTLFLARATKRRREMAVRLSLGASRARIVAMLLTEGMVPGLAAGLLGLGIATWINRSMNLAMASIPFGIPLRFSFGFDFRVVGVALALSLCASLVFGLLPALEGSRPSLIPALKGDRAGVGRRGIGRLRDALVVTQCAASLTLLIGAVLFVRSLSNAADVDLGIHPDRIAIASKQLDDEGLNTDQEDQYIRDLQARLLADPRVENAQISQGVELTLLQVSGAFNMAVEVAGGAADPGATDPLTSNAVTPGYLEMLGVRILRGRGIEETDITGAPLVAVINETFASRYWPGRDPIGQTFRGHRRGSPTTRGAEEDETLTFTVVGITEDGKYIDFDDLPTPYFWSSIFQRPSPRIVISARGLTTAEEVLPVLRERVELAPGEVQLMPPTTLETQFSFQFVHLRIASRVLRWGGGFGLFLAVIGIYGIVSFAVGQRTREVAIRMAMGAEDRQVLGGVMIQGMRPALIGLAVGALLAAAGARLLTSVLVGVGTVDPVAFGGALIILLSAALVASLIPALRALRIDPMRTLREE